MLKRVLALYVNLVSLHYFVCLIQRHFQNVDLLLQKRQTLLQEQNCILSLVYAVT